MKHFSTIAIALIVVLSTAGALHAQPKTAFENKSNYCSEFIGYTLRETAWSGDRTQERNYFPIDHIVADTVDGRKVYRIWVEIPGWWKERVVFLHTEGARNSHTVSVNDTPIGSARDSRLPSEFNISPALITPGVNVITIELPDDTAEPETGLSNGRPDLENVFLYHRPRTYVVDYAMTNTLNDDGKDVNFCLEVIVENTYNEDEVVSVGYDIFSRAGKLATYDSREVKLRPHSRDTLRFRETIYGGSKGLWSASSPTLWDVTMYVAKRGYKLEYIPYRTGFGNTVWNGREILRNGKPVEIKPEGYNAAPTRKQTAADVKALKGKGVNTIVVSYPQPFWFYDLCDEMGIYVIDCANINSVHEPGNMLVGGSLANDPAWLGDYTARVQGMFLRSRNHPCIIGWSLGADHGNGYNMYKVYDWMKAEDPSRPVIYIGADGQWNSDIDLSVL